jgi:hypothetical protein
MKSRKDDALWVVPGNYSSPCFSYPARCVGKAELVKTSQDEGYYRMEGTDGYAMYRLKKRIPQTLLQIDGDTWMLDDPLHWVGMQRLAEHASGKVLVGGLGLGMLVHALSKNDKVTSIDVIEREADVISLVEPLVPKTKPLRIFNKDFYAVLKDAEVYDTVILDFWVTDADSDTLDRIVVRAQMDAMVKVVKERMPAAKVFVWGLADPEINPACTVEGARRKLELDKAISRGVR